MSLLTPKEGQVLARLAKPSCLVIGRSGIVEVLNIVQRLQTHAVSSIDQAESRASHSEFLAKAWWLTLSGALTEEAINHQRRLSDEERADLLMVLQLRYDADAWRAHCELDLPPLPEVDKWQGPKTKEQIEHEVLVAQSFMFGAATSPDAEIHDAIRVG